MEVLRAVCYPTLKWGERGSNVKHHLTFWHEGAGETLNMRGGDRRVGEDALRIQCISSICCILPIQYIYCSFQVHCILATCYCTHCTLTNFFLWMLWSTACFWISWNQHNVKLVSCLPESGRHETQLWIQSLIVCMKLKQFNLALYSVPLRQQGCCLSSCCLPQTLL